MSKSNIVQFSFKSSNFVFSFNICQLARAKIGKFLPPKNHLKPLKWLLWIVIQDKNSEKPRSVARTLEIGGWFSAELPRFSLVATRLEQVRPN